MQIIEVRRIFEPEIARLAAKNRNDEDIKILIENYNELERCDPDNTQLEADIINRFHMNLAKATGNPIVIITMEPIYSLLPRMRNIIYGNIEGEKEYTLKFELDIIEAIKSKDDDRAYKYSVDLLERNREIYDKYYRETI
jgi:GntR family transcriptional repressor for pyruvate dehydrogenase complex